MTGSANEMNVQQPVAWNAVGRDFLHAKYVHVLVKGPHQATNCRRQLADGDAVLPDHSGVDIWQRLSITTSYQPQYGCCEEKR